MRYAYAMTPDRARSGMTPTVYIIDDDPEIRQAASLLLQTVEIPYRLFASAKEFLDEYDLDWPGCILLDVRMPGIGGLELQDRLLEMGSTLPIIFVSGHGDVPMAVQAMHKHAFSFLQKPFREQDLLDNVVEALRVDERRRVESAERQEIRQLLAGLTRRERQVYEFIVAGMANKQVAEKLGLSNRTVEIHRSRIMKKLKASSLAELVRIHIKSLSANGGAQSSIGSQRDSA